MEFRWLKMSAMEEGQTNIRFGTKICCCLRHNKLLIAHYPLFLLLLLRTHIIQRTILIYVVASQYTHAQSEK